MGYSGVVLTPRPLLLLSHDRKKSLMRAKSLRICRPWP